MRFGWVKLSWGLVKAGIRKEKISFLKLIIMCVQFGLGFKCSGAFHSKRSQQGLGDFAVHTVMFSFLFFLKINLASM